MRTKITLIFAIILTLCTAPVSFAATTVFEIHFSDVASPFWGRSGTAVEKIAQQYTPFVDERVCAVEHQVTRFGSPTDAVRLSLYSGGSSPESGFFLKTVALPAASLPTGSGYAMFQFDECVTLSATVSYWFVFGRDVLATGNGYISLFRPSNEFGHSSYWQYNGFDPRGWQENKNREWSLHLIGPEAKEPVLIIPGILGSELYDTNNLVWPNITQMLLDRGDDFMVQSLSLDGNGNSIRTVQTGDIVRAVGTVNIFAGLIESLEEAGYMSEESYFTFPYDWRLSLDISMSLLAEKINTIKQQTGYEKVHVIAHSMGGLLLKDYLHTYGSGLIDKVIFIGTPHLGAPKAAKTILFGDRFGNSWLAEEAMRIIARNALAVYQLLPNQEYFNEFSGYLKPADFAPTMPPLDYAATQDFIGQQGGNPGLVNQAKNFSSKNLHLLNINNGHTYAFIGCNEATQAGYELEQGNTEIKTVKYTSGDKTVPMISAEYLPAGTPYYVTGSTHTQLPSADVVKGAIIQILGDQVPILTSGKINSSSINCTFAGKEMLWRSPVDVHVYDSESNHAGPVENNALENNIPGVSYDIIGHRKFIFLPTDANQTYTVKAVGTDRGTFDLILRDNDNGQITDTAFFNDIDILDGSKIELLVSSVAENFAIAVDVEGDGVPMQIGTVTPESLIADIERALEKGWITKKEVKQELIQKVKAAIRLEKRISKLQSMSPSTQKVERRVERLEERIDRVLGERFIAELEKHQQKGHINDSVYTLLLEGIEWLLASR